MSGLSKVEMSGTFQPPRDGGVMETGMSQQELKRVEVIALRRSGQINQAEAARRLGVTVRQVRRLEAKVAAHGAAGLRSARRGQPSNRRLAPATVTQVGTLIRAHYRDFGPTLAAEYLQERHGIALSKETVRQIMITAKLWRPQRGAKAAIYALRERRPRFGELIQIDGSAHAWFEDRGPRCCLLVFIDDATSRLTQLRFVPQECTLGYMQALHGHIRQHGLPMTLYSDRHGIFRVNSATPAMTPCRSSGARWPRWASKASAPTRPRPRAGWNAPTACCRIACSRPCASPASIPSMRPMPGCRASSNAITPALPCPPSMPTMPMCPTPAPMIARCGRSWPNTIRVSYRRP